MVSRSQAFWIISLRTSYLASTLDTHHTSEIIHEAIINEIDNLRTKAVMLCHVKPRFLSFLTTLAPEARCLKNKNEQKNSIGCASATQGYFLTPTPTNKITIDTHSFFSFSPGPRYGSDCLLSPQIYCVKIQPEKSAQKNQQWYDTGRGKFLIHTRSHSLVRQILLFRQP